MAIAIAVLMVVVAVAFLGGAGRGRPRHAAWEEAARRLRGRLFLREDEPSRLVFPWHGVEAELVRSGGRLHLTTPLPGLVPRRIVAGFPAAPPETAEFGLRAGSESDWEALRGGKGRDLLESLGGAGGEVELNPEDFTASWRSDVDSDVTGQVLRALQLALHAKYAFAGDTGVKVLGVVGMSKGDCQVCGVELDGAVVRCASCATPHHADCWAYVGVCSTYGCGSKESRS